MLRIHNQNVHEHMACYLNSMQSSTNLDTTITDILNVLGNLILQENLNDKCVRPQIVSSNSKLTFTLLTISKS